MPQIADVAVAGVPDDFTGELPRAYVVLRPNATLTSEAVAEHVRNKLIKYKWLVGGVVFVEAIPRNVAGKIIRRNLNVLG